jgi:ribonuclease E
VQTPSATEAAVQVVAAELPAAVAAESAFVAEAPAPVMARAETAPAVPPAEAFAPPAPIVDLDKALEASGLVLIQTDPNKLKRVEPIAEPRTIPSQPRPRRAPPPDTGPLQIVETRKNA